MTKLCSLLLRMVLPGRPGIVGELTAMVYSLSSGSAVWATLIARSAVDGDPTMNGRSAALPAEATTTTPARTMLLTATLRSSWACP